MSYSNRTSHSNQTKIFFNNSNEISISEKNFFMTVCGDLTIKLYDHQFMKEKKLGRIAFNTAFIENNTYKFQIDQIDPDSMQSDSKIHHDYEISVINQLKYRLNLVNHAIVIIEYFLLKHAMYATIILSFKWKYGKRLI